MSEIVSNIVDRYSEVKHDRWAEIYDKPLSWLWGVLALIIIWEIIWISVWIMGVKKKSRRTALLGSFMSTGLIGVFCVLKCSKNWHPIKASHDYVWSHGYTQEMESNKK